MKKLLLTLLFSSIIVAVPAQDIFTNNNRSFSVDTKNISLNKKSSSFGHNRTYDFAATSSMNEGGRPFIKRAMFNMYIDWNLHLGESFHHTSVFYNADAYAGFTWGCGMYFTFGARIKDYVFVGGGFGVEFLPSVYTAKDFDSEWWDSYKYVGGFCNMPMYLNVRAFIPATSRIFPYVDIAVGPSLLFYLDRLNDFMLCPIATHLRAGIGTDISRFSVGLGYEGVYGHIKYEEGSFNEYGVFIVKNIITEPVIIHAFYLKLGIRIGSME